ncbi:hypothetical protein DM01DRAFT_1340942 [Hesseltinella vesiculosa]|uniref:Uncharacterized protein n=1 Tax=Hesseltinella vesiculosa TaxID=101127 RepID=A0A1X2G3M3_9FUNG|nr:hypothetical protein DM01DRAFT_1340942 [Hesseltinella vesiculosa]
MANEDKNRKDRRREIYKPRKSIPVVLIIVISSITLNAARSIPMTLQERQRESASLNMPPHTPPPHDSQAPQHDQWAFVSSVFSFTRKALG